MSQLPFMPLYVDVYEAHTSHLTPAEDGIYSRLLRLLWRSPGCSIPDDPRWLARHLRIDADTFARLAMPVIDEFCTRKNGKIYQRRLTAEWAKARDRYDRKSAAGKKGGAAKALKMRGSQPDNDSVLPGLSQSQSQSQSEISSIADSVPEGREVVAFPISDQLARSVRRMK